MIQNRVAGVAEIFELIGSCLDIQYVMIGLVGQQTQTKSLFLLDGLKEKNAACVILAG